MYQEILSPYTGRPVKFRTQDVGRTLRDDEGNLFYVLLRTDGQGYYASFTRAGGPKELERYEALVAKGVQAKANGAIRSGAQVTATRSGRCGRLWLAAVAVIVLAAAAYATGPWGLGWW
jgi:hypothetical protein